MFVFRKEAEMFNITNVCQAKRRYENRMGERRREKAGWN